MDGKEVESGRHWKGLLNNGVVAVVVGEATKLLFFPLQAAFALERALHPTRQPSSSIAINKNARFLPHKDSGAGDEQGRRGVKCCRCLLLLILLLVAVCEGINHYLFSLHSSSILNH